MNVECRMKFNFTDSGAVVHPLCNTLKIHHQYITLVIPCAEACIFHIVNTQHCVGNWCYCVLDPMNVYRNESGSIFFISLGPYFCNPTAWMILFQIFINCIFLSARSSLALCLPGLDLPRTTSYLTKQRNGEWFDWSCSGHLHVLEAFCRRIVFFRVPTALQVCNSAFPLLFHSSFTLQSDATFHCLLWHLFLQNYSINKDVMFINRVINYICCTAMY